MQWKEWVRKRERERERGGRHVRSLCTYESADDLSEDDVFAVEPARFAEQDEELGTVAVLAVVRHRNPARVAMTQDKLLVVETFTIDALACDITSDKHVNHCVRWRIFHLSLLAFCYNCIYLRY